MIFLVLVCTGLLLFLLLVYFFVLHQSWQYFKTMSPVFHSERIEGPKLSVVIAARNEENDIVQTLHSIFESNHCGLLQEIIIVDDHSTDSTAEKIKNLHHTLVRYTRLPEVKTGKKEALTHGIHLASSDIIAVTDADSIVSKNWINILSAAYKNDPELVMTTGLVLPDSPMSMLGRFQWLDFAATMAITNLGIRTKTFYLANGASMSFRKSAFEKVSGFTGNIGIASGDDVFLIKKMAGLSGKNIQFINHPDAVVYTKAEKSAEDFWRQRKRWATKSKSYASPRILGIQMTAFLLAFSIPLLLVFSLIFEISFLIPAVIVFFGKYGIDYYFLSHLSRSLQKKDAMKNFMTSYLLYLAYIIIMGFHALFPTTTTWKGREI